VTFGEDHSRIRNEDSAENIAVLRSIALNLLKRDPSKSSLRQKRFRAAMDNDFLLHLITHSVLKRSPLLWYGRQHVQKRAGYVGFGSWGDSLVSSVKKRLVSSIEDVSRM